MSFMNSININILYLCLNPKNIFDVMYKIYLFFIIFNFLLPKTPKRTFSWITSGTHWRFIKYAPNNFWDNPIPKITSGIEWQCRLIRFAHKIKCIFQQIVFCFTPSRRVNGCINLFEDLQSGTETRIFADRSYEIFGIKDQYRNCCPEWAISVKNW